MINAVGEHSGGAVEVVSENEKVYRNRAGLYIGLRNDAM